MCDTYPLYLNSGLIQLYHTYLSYLESPSTALIQKGEERRASARSEIVRTHTSPTNLPRPQPHTHHKHQWCRRRCLYDLGRSGGSAATTGAGTGAGTTARGWTANCSVVCRRARSGLGLGIPDMITTQRLRCMPRSYKLLCSVRPVLISYY